MKKMIALVMTIALLLGTVAMAKGIAFHANPDDRTMTFAFSPVTDANADVVSLIMGSMMTTEALEASGFNSRQAYYAVKARLGE